MSAGETVSLAVLLDSLLQKAYHDLTILAELLPRKSDGDRKVEIVQFARRTRLLLIRLLALVKWAGNSGNVQICSELSALLSRQAQLYVGTADQLHLTRQTLVQACTPNFSLAPALDVLGSGSYPRLPTCIRDRIVGALPLSPEERLGAFSLLDCAVRRRLMLENIPQSLRVTRIGKGLVTFTVPYEFELSLSVVSDDLTIPWRVVDLRILVGDTLPGRPVLVHESQRLSLHQLLQSRLFGGDAPLVDCHQLLHTFCLNLQLDCLHSQAQRLSSEVYGGYVKVDEYTPGQHVKVAYWRPMGATQFLSAFLLNQARAWPKVAVAVNPSHQDRPFSISHDPPLPGSQEVAMVSERLSVEDLLAECVAVRSRASLKEMRESLRGTPWEGQATVSESHMCVSVIVPVKYGRRRVVLGVDPRVGNVVASVEPQCTCVRVQQCLVELEKVVTANRESLPAQLSTLQCQLFLTYLAEQASELGQAVSWSLPLHPPLPLRASPLLFVQVRPLAYLIVGVEEGLVDHYHLLQLVPTLTLPQTGMDTGETVPQSFYTATSLLELDPAELQTQHLHAILVAESIPRLKRKLRECGLHLPNPKRLCVRPAPSFPPTPALVRTRLSLQRMQASLEAAGISAHHVTYSEYGAPCIHIFRFPSLAIESTDVHHQLSSHLQSCRISPTDHGYHCRLVFSAALECQCGHEAVLCVDLPPEVDVGQSLLLQWQAKLSLLGMALEMDHYLQGRYSAWLGNEASGDVCEMVHCLQDSSWPHHSECTISGFTFEQLTLEFGRHSMVVKAGGGDGLRLKFSDGCPHALVVECLERFLDTTRSLPLFLQGLWVTEGVMHILDEFVDCVPGTSVSAGSPAQIQLRYNNFCVRMSLQADSTVQMTDISYSKPILAGVHISAPGYMQAFLRSSLLGISPDAEEALPLPPSHPLPAASKTILMPSPSPIISARLSPWPGSPLPSIPSLPSPRETHLGSQPGVMFTASAEQFKQLFAEVEGCSPMEGFLGGLALLYQFVQHPSHEKYQQIQPPLQFVSCDRGVYTYRADSLLISLSLYMGTVPALKLGLKAAQENVWSPGDLEVISKFFKAEVVCRPFSSSAMQAFVHVLLLPLPTLRSCVQLMQMHMVPQAGAVWRIALCMTVPQGTDLPDVGNISLSPGAAGVVYWGRLVLVMRMVNLQDGGEHILALIHDPKTNQTSSYKGSGVRSALYQAVDTVLKKTLQDYQSGLLTLVSMPSRVRRPGNEAILPEYDRQFLNSLSGHPRPDSSALYFSLRTLSLASLPV